MRISRQDPWGVWCLLPLMWLVASMAGGMESGDTEGANRLEARGLELWNQGEFESAAEAIEAAVAIDPTDPERPFRYGELLTAKGRESTREGDVARAAWAFAGAERLWVATIRIGKESPENRELMSQAYRGLAEIAETVRQDATKAAEFLAEAERLAPRESPTEPLFGPVGAAVAPSAKPVPKPEPAPVALVASQGAVPLIAIGVANSIRIAGQRLRLAAEGVKGDVKVREYVPVGQTTENWTALFAQRQHPQTASPTLFASSLGEHAAGSGGRVVAATTGPGESASIAFVVHAPKEQLSEVNAWRFFLRESQLISLQYAERVTGEHHVERAERIAKEKSPVWLRELQVRRAVGLSEPETRLAEAAGEAEAP